MMIHMPLSLILAYAVLCAAAAAAAYPTPAPARGPAPHSLPFNATWSFADAPEFCRKIIASPRAADSQCRRDRSTMRCRDGRYVMFSQMSQDYYLYTRHFSTLKRPGVYLDVATNDPVGISNTYFFEKCLGWAGLCVEANPQYLASIHKFRNCALVPTCVSDKEGRNVEFALSSGLSGILDTNKNVKNWKKEGTVVPTIKQKCSTMRTETKRYGVRRADYLSLDVEGHELQVLQGFDWDHFVVNVITVEATPDNLPPIEDFLLGKGYVRHIPTLDDRSFKSGKLNEDAVFLYHDVEFGDAK